MFLYENERRLINGKRICYKSIRISKYKCKMHLHRLSSHVAKQQPSEDGSIN
jgi:hypothetical protein